MRSILNLSQIQKGSRFVDFYLSITERMKGIETLPSYNPRVTPINLGSYQIYTTNDKKMSIFKGIQRTPLFLFKNKQLKNLYK